jgi:hypothetical protein
MKERNGWDDKRETIPGTAASIEQTKPPPATRGVDASISYTSGGACGSLQRPGWPTTRPVQLGEGLEPGQIFSSPLLEKRMGKKADGDNT